MVPSETGEREEDLEEEREEEEGEGEAGMFPSALYGTSITRDKNFTRKPHPDSLGDH